jgi:hypothetical protein
MAYPAQAGVSQQITHRLKIGLLIKFSLRPHEIGAP